MESVSRPAGPSLDLSLDVVQECLLGGALGDALGYPIEFTSSAEIRRRFGAAPPERLEYAGGGLAQISDDTQMTLFVAEGVIRGVQRAEDRGSCFMPSVVTRGHPSGYLSAAYFASVVWDVARGSALSHAMLQADDQLAGETGGGELIDILARARKLAERGPPRRREDRVARRRLDRRAGPRHRAAMRTHLRPRAPRRLQDDDLAFRRPRRRQRQHRRPPGRLAGGPRAARRDRAYRHRPASPHDPRRDARPRGLPDDLRGGGVAAGA